MAKAKIALVVDVKNWAFDNIAQQIKLYLSDIFQIEIIYHLEDFTDFAQLYRYLFSGEFEIVHFFWRPHLKNFFNYAFLKDVCPSFTKLLTNISRTIITTSVYDHLFLERDAIISYKSFFGEIIDAYTVSSKRLCEIYIDRYPSSIPSAVIQDGVDLNLFSQLPNARILSNKKQSLIVGWAGNSKWGKIGKDSKGLHSIIKPAIKRIQKRGFDMTAVFADRNLSFIPLNEMKAYYNQLDVYVCASDIEGTPNPVLEAMACGVPVIVMSDSPKNCEYVEESGGGLVVEPNAEAIRDALQRITPEMGERGYTYIQSKWTEEHYAHAILDGIKSL